MTVYKGHDPITKRWLEQQALINRRRRRLERKLMRAYIRRASRTGLMFTKREHRHFCRALFRPIAYADICERRFQRQVMVYERLKRFGSPWVRS